MSPVIACLAFLKFYVSFVIWFVFGLAWLFETRSLRVVEVGPELMTPPRLTSGLHQYLPSTGIADLSHHTQLELHP